MESRDSEQRAQAGQMLPSIVYAQNGQASKYTWKEPLEITCVPDLNAGATQRWRERTLDPCNYLTRPIRME